MNSTNIESLPLRRKFPAAALAALGLIAVFEFGVIRSNRDRILDANYILLEKKQRALTSHSRPDDIAIFGTSRFYHVQPDRIKELLPPGSKVTNYAWSWCGVEIFEAMYRALISADRIPKILLIDAQPELFGYNENEMTITGTKFYRTRYAETAPFWPALRTTLGLKYWRESWNLLLYNLTPPSVLYQDRVKPAMQYLRHHGKLPDRPFNYNLLVSNWERDGYFLYVDPPNRNPAYEEFLGLERDTGPWEYREERELQKSYYRLIELAQAHGTRVILLPVPLNPHEMDVFTAKGIFRGYDAFLDDLEKRYANFSAPGPRYFTWPDALGDAGHVNAQGARQHMDLLLKLLKQELAKDN